MWHHIKGLTKVNSDEIWHFHRDLSTNRNVLIIPIHDDLCGSNYVDKSYLYHVIVQN